MGSAIESFPQRTQALKSSSLRSPVVLQSRGHRVSVDPDASVRYFDSMVERRALFGFEQPWFYKVQAGIVVHGQKPDWGVRASPGQVQFAGKVFDGAEVAQSVELYPGNGVGYLRTLRVRNTGATPLRLRILDLQDPTAAHFGEGPHGWGSLGVNAFNRVSHVAMDEVSDPPSARVVGASPAPSKFYLTTSRTRVQELISAGDISEGTAGMSGQVLVLSSHELDLAPGASRELTFAFIYSPGKLEDVLSEFSRLQSGERAVLPAPPTLAASDPKLTEAAAWATSAAGTGGYASDPLDRYESLRALTLVDVAEARRVFAEAKLAVRRDGSLPHSLDPAKPGPLETSVFLQAFASYLLQSQDRKLLRSSYPLVKKLAGFLLLISKDADVKTDPALPQGWRRRLGRGYPTGEIPELSLAVAGALRKASYVARAASKSEDAGRFRERSEVLGEEVKKNLVDERGVLCLCRDSSGRVRSEDTVDMAVAAYRHQSGAQFLRASAHRLLEKDFDTAYGPRCVPSTNQVYFNGAYGTGQLGGVWPRAVLAHAVECYRGGLAGIGAMALQKSASLAAESSAKLGGAPGEFPLWIDADGEEAHGGSDPVAAARFIEALVFGELGLDVDGGRLSISPPPSSALGWVFAANVWVGEPASIFVGRGGGGAHLFFAAERLESQKGTKFASWDSLDLPAKGVWGVSYSSPGQVICLGNGNPAPARLEVRFAPRAAELSRRLSTPLESYDQSAGTWTKSGSLRVFQTMSFEASLGPGEWKAFRVSTP